MRQWAPLGDALAGGASILLFHDSLGCVDLWRDFPQQLASATGLRVVAYDRLGFGRSNPHPGPLPLTFIQDEAVEVVPRLREELGCGPMVLFGHSVGGAMAIATAAHLSEICIGVITESAQSFVEDRTRSGIRTAQADFDQPARFARLERYHGAKARWVLDSWIETWLSAAFADWSLDKYLRDVRCPTLALHGDRDEFGSRRHAERIASLTQSASRAVILEDCGHLPHREQMARVLVEVAGFLIGG